MPIPFHPLIDAWFTETYGSPTPVQEEAWPLIANGENVLALAPTGSGKTLTGFLAAISRFAQGVYEAGRLSVIYVSPLKALNEDIRRNLIQPLEGIRARFERAGEDFPAIRVETRSGDTPQAERRRFLMRPPSILALTPESLGIILLNPRGRQVLSSVRYVILDEIHTALGSKRGCFLSCQIDRLALAAGEFQRVALSATVKSPEAAADFAGGLRKTANDYIKRKVHIVSPESKKALEFKVIFPDEEAEPPGAEDSIMERYGKRYAELVRFIIGRIRLKNQKGGAGSILVFTDSRRRAERLSYLLNRASEEEEEFAGRPIAYCHHGSLAKEVRRAVETALADGEISCVVATGSLELGIDIGGVEEVILAGSPGVAAIALQRVGRSGHGVGMTSRGWLIPFHGMDLLKAAEISGASQEKETEESSCIENPLDVLAQILLSLITEKEWNEEELYETIRGFYVYRNLPRGSYDGVIRMLAGAYEETRLRELNRRIFRDEETGTLSTAPGALPLLYTSGGVIASRGYYSLRLASGIDGAGTKIGELDEEFVWERRIGDCFDFGNRSWRITVIGNEAVEAVPLPKGADSVPFWRGDTIFRSVNLSRRILETIEAFQESGSRAEKTALISSFSPEAGKALADFLSAQKSVQGKVPLSGPFFIPVEIVDDPVGRGDSYSVIFHSFRGGAVNFPFSLALARDLEAHCNVRVEGSADDNAVFLRLPRSIMPDPASMITESLRRLAEGDGEKSFRERLESSGIFGAAFREAAERSLLLPRSPFGKRTPLWILRQRSKRLFDAVSSFRDFPASAEAWRTCLLDTFDMKGFRALLEDIGSGALRFDFFKTKQHSPFSAELAWAETNTLMYEYDERPDLTGSKSGTSLSDQVIAEALGDAGARPPLKPELVADFCSRLRRELPGWAPEDALTHCEWVKERIAIPANGKDGEWERLLKHIPAELAEALAQDRSLGGKLRYIRLKEPGTEAVIHRDMAEFAVAKSAVAKPARSRLAQWLRYEGPVAHSGIGNLFGFSPEETEEAIQALSESGELVRDVAVESSDALPFVDSGAGLVCDRENLELLLRMSRRKRRPDVKERPAPVLVPFLARRQGFVPDEAEAVSMAHNTPWKRLEGLAAPAKLWETELFPCRFPSYTGEMLDRELREGRLIWYGAGKEKNAFCQSGDLDLALPVSPAPPFREKLSPDFFDTPRSFWEIKDALAATNAGIGSVAEALWEEVWSGSLSADSWEPLRRALELGFTSAEPSSGTGPAESGGKHSRRPVYRRVPRALRARWKAGPPIRGNWFSLSGEPSPGEEISLLEEEELNRDRVRLLLDRWGILARPLLEREAPVFSWSRLLPAMRRMELAGELVAGRFFGGINSLQFASPRIAEELEEAEAWRGVYWMNAADPASPAGLEVQGITREGLQIRRVSSSRLCFRGAELLAISNRGGKNLEIFVSTDDPDIAEVMSFVKFPRTRNVRPEAKLVIEKINGATAARSVYSQPLVSAGFFNERGKMVLW
jgi:ATP-dependent Lhr-like helicase